jgi:DNA-binding LacI/PurR family transcriptional regulator
MTTVAQRSSEMGKIAVKLLFDRIHSPQHAVEGGILLPTSLVVRGSVRDITKLESRKEQHRVCG